MPNHFNLEDCERFLHDENQFSPGASKRIEKYLKISQEGLDEFLIRFPEMIRNEDQLFYIVRFMRAHHKFDTQDHERIFNNYLFTTMERKVTELLAVVEQKDPHTYWYLMHALQSKHSPLYEHLHGSIRCCGTWKICYCWPILNVYHLVRYCGSQIHDSLTFAMDNYFTSK